MEHYKHRIYRVTDTAENSEQMALCAMIDALYYFDWARTGGAAASVSVGSVSSSRAQGAQPDLSPAAQNRELYRCAQLYLDIYRGTEGDGDMFRVRPGPPVDYSLCNQTVTLYHADLKNGFQCTPNLLFFEVHFLTPRRCRPWTKSEGRRQTVSCLFFHPGGMAVRCGWMRQRRSLLVQIKRCFPWRPGTRRFWAMARRFLIGRTGEFFPGQCAGAGCGQGRGCEILARGSLPYRGGWLMWQTKRGFSDFRTGQWHIWRCTVSSGFMKDKGLDSSGDVQMFHTQNVLRRIVRYMPYQSGMTPSRLSAAQTNIRKPLIVTDTPSARFLFNGKLMVSDVTGSPWARKGETKHVVSRPLDYTKTKNPKAGPFWDRALSTAEGPAMAADVQRYIRSKGG